MISGVEDFLIVVIFCKFFFEVLVGEERREVAKGRLGIRREVERGNEK